MLEKTPPTIFLSYCQANSNATNIIDNDFKSIGISFSRDIRDVNYLTSIRQFMKKINSHDFVILIISDEYLRSVNCMYEVAEVLSSSEFEKRILPIYLSNASGIFKADSRLVYYEYWNDQLKKSEDRLNKYYNEDYLDQHKLIQHICSRLDVFFNKITDLKLKSLDELISQKYEPLLKFMDIDAPDLLEEVIEISKIKDFEDQEIAIESFLVTHPLNKFGLFQKAFICQKREFNKKAIYYYTYLIEQYPHFTTAYLNLSIIYRNVYDKLDEALKYCLTAIEQSPNYSAAHFTIGQIYTKLKMFQKAEEHFEIVTKLEPSNASAFYNLGNIQYQYLKLDEKAKSNFEKALKFNPNFKEAHNNLGHLYETQKITDIALSHYNSAIDNGLDDYKARMNRANLFRSIGEVQKAEADLNAAKSKFPEKFKL